MTAAVCSDWLCFDMMASEKSSDLMWSSLLFLVQLQVTFIVIIIIIVVVVSVIIKQCGCVSCIIKISCCSLQKSTSVFVS